MIIGAVYMMNNYDTLARGFILKIFPLQVWIVIGTLQIMFSLGLFIPKIKNAYKHTIVCAIALMLISPFGIVLYSAYTGFGVLWAIIPAGFCCILHLREECGFIIRPNYL